MSFKGFMIVGCYVISLLLLAVYYQDHHSKTYRLAPTGETSEQGSR